jgi:hypothetical protein
MNGFFFIAVGFNRRIKELPKWGFSQISRVVSCRKKAMLPKVHDMIVHETALDDNSELSSDMTTAISEVSFQEIWDAPK